MIAEELPVSVVDGIEVSEQAFSLEYAKSNAMFEGSQKAALQILQRLAPLSHNIATKVALQNFVYEKWIKKIEAYDERINSNAYQAKLRVSFNLDEVRKALLKSGVRVGVSWSPKLLIVPALVNDSALDDEFLQSWINAWEDLPSEIGLLRYKVLKYNLDDLSLLYHDTKELLKKYDSQELVWIKINKTKSGIQVNYQIKSIAQKIVENNSTYEDSESLQDIALSVASHIDAIYKGVQ